MPVGVTKRPKASGRNVSAKSWLLSAGIAIAMTTSAVLYFNLNQMPLGGAEIVLVLLVSIALVVFTRRLTTWLRKKTA